MSSQGNPFAFARHFFGDIRSGSESVPIRISTRLRVMPNETAREVRKYGNALLGSPQYVFSQGWDLSLRPTLEAIGRHYFTW